ncbi:MAG TPA: DUF87 domain-containing protein, partial [Candidatus Eisenbacteria bacterium]|nr:DUF87 domain-containing protein [Candidatus Eisenbacteria bacterium]
MNIPMITQVNFFDSLSYLSGMLLALGLLAGVLYVGGYALFLWYKWNGREKASLDSVLLQVSLPRDNEIKIDAAEQLFSGFASLRKSGRFAFLKPQQHISFEIVGKPGDIRYYIHVPKKLRDLVEKQINGAYPDADIAVVDEADAKQKGVIGNEYNIFSEDGKVAFASWRPKGPAYTQMKIYKDMAVDGMSLLTSTLAKMQEGEGAAIQIMISPADGKWKKIGRGHIGKVKKAESNPEKATYSADPKELETIENKIGKPGFDVVIRAVVCSSTMESAKGHLDNIGSALAMFGATNSLKKNKHRFKGLFMHDFIYRYWPMYKGTGVMSSEELATIYHFPNKQVTTPGIFWLTSKRAPAPTQIPDNGLYIGKSTFRGLSRPVYMLQEDRARHMYIIGKTGTGKSQFLKQMIIQDIENGEGICVIDPHGDLIEEILLRVPPNRAEDVIVFDPSDTQRPMGINIMEAYTEEQKHYMVSSIIGLFYKLYDPNKTGIVGPRLE